MPMHVTRCMYTPVACVKYMHHGMYTQCIHTYNICIHAFAAGTIAAGMKINPYSTCSISSDTGVQIHVVIMHVVIMHVVFICVVVVHIVRMHV